MMKVTAAVLLLLAVQTTVSQDRDYPQAWKELHDSRDWNLIEETGRVRVATKMLNLSPVPAIRVELDTPADPRSLMDLVWAVDEYSRNMPSSHIIESGFISRADSSRQVAWQIIDAPFIAPRIYQYEHLRKHNRIEWHKTTPTNPLPEQGEAIVAPVNFGSWEVVTGVETNTLIYRACTHPGGGVPAWIVKLANRRNLPRMLLELEAAATTTP